MKRGPRVNILNKGGESEDIAYQRTIYVNFVTWKEWNKYGPKKRTGTMFIRNVGFNRKNVQDKRLRDAWVIKEGGNGRS